jgi:hypothetical protein
MNSTAYVQIGDVQLKEGDRVAVEAGRNIPDYQLGTIKRITPTGQIVVTLGSTDCRFNAEGWEMGNTGFRRRSFGPVTDEIRVSIMRKRITYYAWGKASPDTITRVATLLGLEV